MEQKDIQKDFEIEEEKKELEFHLDNKIDEKKYLYYQGFLHVAKSFINDLKINKNAPPPIKQS